MTIVWFWAGGKCSQVRWEVLRLHMQTKQPAYLKIQPNLLSIYDSCEFLAPGPSAFVLAVLHSHILVLWCGSLCVICILTFALEESRHVLSVPSVEMNWMVWIFFSNWPGSDEKDDLFSMERLGILGSENTEASSPLKATWNQNYLFFFLFFYLVSSYCTQLMSVSQLKEIII